MESSRTGRPSIGDIQPPLSEFAGPLCALVWRSQTRGISSRRPPRTPNRGAVSRSRPRRCLRTPRPRSEATRPRMAGAHAVGWYQPRARVPAALLEDVAPASIRTRPTWLHRCPVCQASRSARRAVHRWRCAACVRAGLNGLLLIERVP